MTDKKTVGLPDTPTPPSEDFLRAFVHSGMIRATCECGRELYNSADAGCFEEGELEALEARSLEEPDRCIDLGHSVGLVDFAGGQYVDACPCNRLYRYELFVWQNREDIARYVRARADDQMTGAMRSVTAALKLEAACEEARE